LGFTTNGEDWIYNERDGVRSFIKFDNKILFNNKSSDQCTSTLWNNELPNTLSSRGWESAELVIYMTAITLSYSCSRTQVLAPVHIIRAFGNWPCLIKREDCFQQAKRYIVLGSLLIRWLTGKISFFLSICRFKSWSRNDSRICIIHHVRMSTKLIDEKKQKGEGQLTPAFEKTATDLSLGVKEVREYHKTGRRYMQLAQHENGGPGTLFLTGPRVSTM
jgi:hypothetical protein